MFPHHIKRENTENTFLMEMPDILMLWVQILWDDRLRLPNVGHWKVYGKRPKSTWSM